MNESVIQSIQEHSKAYKSERDLDKILQEIGDSRIVLLGEASHGTSEYYKIRTELSKRLIEEKGFNIIAVEGDWPASQSINKYIKGNDETANPRDVLQSFKRWPTWMWANEEVVELISWLKEYNAKKASKQKAGFYGIDVYSLWESMEEVILYLENTNSPDLEKAKKAFSCFEPFNKEPQEYAVSAGYLGEDCTEEIVGLLSTIRANKKDFAESHEQELNLEVNAMVAANAEHYYRAMVSNDEKSWNIRDEHMVEALNAVMKFYGEEAKVIVWEHNTHVGDARATDMMEAGMTNVGQIVREQNPKEDVYIVGFGTHRGTVIASKEWGVNLEKMEVPPAQRGSWEDAMHQAGNYNQLLLFNDENRKLFHSPLGHRAIGVVYRPQYEQYGNYVPSIMSERYDAFIYIDESNALQPLELSDVRL
ncbi:erythromycin esterase family protein [Rossellomorea vietnamensis]|uniref:Erythromycin esterase family protein n=1 Tax=Rossellomorea vietnamensis TaxID=218284 RepID=A0A5D4NLW1_9BACI|nr:erythromycin esterase family protein [Rossellomorea vietnamensis]TYS14501.1 erythromycin esterase family protein [Rossellomorea vietnamensis]